VAINRNDGMFQVSYWLDAAKIENDPDDAEYSDFLMELKERIYKVFRQSRFKYAAIFRWNEGTNNWDLLEEFEPRH
jgi:hypothetical protein